MKRGEEVVSTADLERSGLLDRSVGASVGPRVARARKTKRSGSGQRVRVPREAFATLKRSRTSRTRLLRGQREEAVRMARMAIDEAIVAQESMAGPSDGGRRSSWMFEQRWDGESLVSIQRARARD